MSFPQLIFEWSPTTNPLDTPTWVEMNDAQGFDVLRSYSIKRGRKKWLDTPQAGTATVRLRNRDGSLTFGSANPNVQPIKRCRIRLVYNSTSYTRFTGFFNQMALSWNRDESEVTAQLYDGLALLALGRLKAPYPLTVIADGPIAYWRFAESSGALTAADSSGNGVNGTYSGTGVTFGVSPGAVVDAADKAITFDGASGYVSAPFNIPLNQSFSLEFLFKLSGAGVQYFLSTGGFGPQVFSPGNGAVTFSGLGTDSKSGSYLDGKWHHVICTATALGGGNYSNQIYVDGVGGPGGGGAPGGMNSTLWMGCYGGINDFLGGSMDEVAVYNYALSPTQATIHYNAVSGWLGMASGTRISTVAGLIGWNAADEYIDAGVSLLANASDLGGQAPLQHFQQVAATEGGLLFIGQDGRLRFIDRHSLQTSPYNVSMATFGDGGGAEISYDNKGLAPLVDDVDIWNVVQVTRKDGGVLSARASQAQIDLYGPAREKDLTSIASSDLEAQDQAFWELIQDQGAQQRMQQMNITGYDANFAVILGRELGDLITVKGSPPNTGGGRISQDVRILGMSESAEAKARKFQATWSLWPKEPQAWILGDATWGVLGSTTVAGF